MKRVLLLIILVIVCECDYQKSVFDNRMEYVKKYQSMFDVMDNIFGEFIVGGPRMTGAATTSSINFPWIVSVVELPTETEPMYKRGPAAIVTTRVAIMHGATAFSIIEILNTVIISKTDTMGVFTGPNAVVRRVKNIIFDVNPTPVSAHVALLTFCPPLDANFVAPMPTLVGAYPTGTTVRYYNYMDAFSTSTKTIAPSGTCNYPAVTPASHTFCLSGTGPVSIQNGDYLGTIAVIDGKFAGINIVSNSGKGELFVDIRSQLDFIAKN